MGTWATPEKEHQAAKLAILMKHPIPQQYASDWLCDLCGNDALFDFFDTISHSQDVRPNIIKILERWVLDMGHKWEPESLNICNKIISDYNMPSTNFQEFSRELAELSMKHSVILHVTGGVEICNPELSDLSNLKYTNDESSGDIHPLNYPKIIPS